MIKRKWRVFIASTDRDLKYARASITEKIEGLGFEPVIFERGSFVIDPELHSHDTCLRSVETSDIFLLILDKRSGGPYLGKKGNPSITEKEYEIAIQNNIPTIVLVNQRLEQERFDRVGKIRETHPKISNNELSLKLKDTKTRYADSAKLLVFLQKIHKSTVGNYINYFDDLHQLNDKVIRGLKALTPTILRKLSSNQRTDITTRSTALGKEYDISYLINSEYMVEPKLVFGDGSAVEIINSNFSVVVSDNKISVIVGKPGSGKSILTAKIFIELFTRSYEKKSIEVPVYLDLRSLKKSNDFSTIGILSNAFGLYLQKELYPTLDLDICKPIFILDGFDEIPEHLIEHLIYIDGLKNLQSVRGLISVRNSYFDLYIRGTKIENDIGRLFKLQEWGTDQGINFVKKWLTKVSSNELADKFERYAKNNRLNEIFSSPIMASMYAFSTKYLNRIPEQISDRATLYQFFMHALALHEVEKNYLLLEDASSVEKIKNCWQHISWEIYRNRLDFKTLYINVLKQRLSEKDVSDKIIDQSISGLVNVDNLSGEVKSLLHETMLEFLLASYGVQTMLYGEEINDFLDCTLSSDVTSFVREIWSRLPPDDLNKTLENLSAIIRYSSQNQDEENQRRASNGIYYLSRVPLNHYTIKALQYLLSIPLTIFLRNGILFALSKLGDSKSEDLLSVDIMSNKEANNLNRGLHLEYFGDIKPKSYFPPKDPGNTSIDKSIFYLLEHLRRGDIRDVRTSRIDIITIMSLSAIRGKLTENLLNRVKRYLNEMIRKYPNDSTIPEHALRLLEENPLEKWMALK